jgi:hypothetical protein
MGGGGAQRPVWHVIKPKKTGARGARARTRGQTPLVVYIPLHFFLNCRPVGIGQRFSMGLRRKYGVGGLTERSTKEGVITGRNVTLTQFLLDSGGLNM